MREGYAGRATESNVESDSKLRLLKWRVGVRTRASETNTRPETDNQNILRSSATVFVENREFSLTRPTPKHAPIGAAWRYSRQRRFAVPLQRVRQVRALFVAVIPVAQAITATNMKTLKQIVGIVALTAALNTTQAQSWLTNGLIAYYPFDGHINDNSGAGANGTFQGVGHSNITGVVGQAVKMWGDTKIVGSGINIANTSFTISFWYRRDFTPRPTPPLYGGGFGVDFQSGDIAGKHLHIGFDYGAPNQTRYSFWYNDFDVQDVLFGESGWEQIVFTFDQSSLERRIYRNGTLLATNHAAYGFSGNNNFAIVGGDAATVSRPTAFDEFRVYNRTLSANEIAQLYAFESHTPLFDNFTASVIDGSKWEVRKTFGDSDVFVDSGNAVLLNRGKLLSQMPMPASIRINVRFKFTGSQNDVFRVVWRSNGDDSNISNGARELLNWVGVSAQQAHSENGFNGSLSLDWINHPFAAGSLALLNTNLLPNTYYELRIVDDGSNINVFWGTNTTPILTGNIPSSWGNRLGLYNREGTGGGSSISAGSQVKIDYVRVEDRTCTPHQATAIAIVENGQVVGAVITDGGCGYTNAPLLLIQGGGGSGALATTAMVDGEIISINLINGGSGYSTNPAPKIVIASPPFVPTVSIRFSRVEVAQHVTLGRKYVLESSTNLVNWSATGPSFTAVSENYTNEFVIGQIGSFFRLREVP